LQQDQIRSFGALHLYSFHCYYVLFLISYTRHYLSTFSKHGSFSLTSYLLRSLYWTMKTQVFYLSKCRWISNGLHWDTVSFILTAVRLWNLVCSSVFVKSCFFTNFSIHCILNCSYTPSFSGRNIILSSVLATQGWLWCRHTPHHTGDRWNKS
jgi:hypothetical protein